MTNNNNRKKLAFLINFAYIASVIVTVIILFRYALPLLLPFLVAAAISYAAEPGIRFMIEKLHFNRTIASVVCILFFTGLAVSVLLMLSTTVLSKCRDIYNSLPSYIDSVRNYFQHLQIKSDSYISTPFENFLLLASEYVKRIDFTALIGGSFGSFAIKSFSGMFTAIPYLVTSLLITVISAVFISISFDDIKAFILHQCTPGGCRIILETKKSIVSIFKKYVKSYAALMLITFSELTLFFLIFRIKPAASIAFIIAIVDILPVLGVGTVMIPWSLICFLSGSISKGLVLLSVYAVITVVRQIIEPKIVGENIGLHPLVTLISIYIGLKLLGILGIFLAPILLMLVSDLQRKGFFVLWRTKPVDK